MSTLSLRSRLTLWYTVVLVVLLIAFGADVIWIQGRLGIRRLDGELADIETTLVTIVSNELLEKDSPTEAAEEAVETVADRRLTMAVLDAKGTVLAAKESGIALSELLAAVSGLGSSTIQAAPGRWRVRSSGIKANGQDLHLLVAMPLSDIAREQHEVEEAMRIGIPIMLALAGAGGWWIASVGLAPISKMAGQAIRLPLSGSDDLGDDARGDEVGQLARAFNGLVARLRVALQTQRQFMADASHELRTPLSIVRTAAEVTLSQPHRPEDEYRDTLVTVGEQTLRLGRLVDDMLVLARADAGGYPIRPVELDLDEIVDECRRAVGVLATERGVRIEWSAGVERPFRGDADLLRRMVLNLLQNAIQYTPAGGAVIVSVEGRQDATVIRVSDEGAGVPAADRARIFERFARLDQARAGSGAGLGLPIARWIAEAHGGTLVLEASGAGGSTFSVSLRVPPALAV